MTILISLSCNAHTHTTHNTHALPLTHTTHHTCSCTHTHTHIADPYGIVSISRYSHTTRVVEQSVCPTWDQTIILDDIFLFGNPDSILQSPPTCTVEFYDKDLIVRRGLCKIASLHHSCSHHSYLPSLVFHHSYLPSLVFPS